MYFSLNCLKVIEPFSIVCMSWDLDIFSLIVLFGACQGLILSCILFFQPGNQRTSAKFLAFFMLILAYNGFETFNWSAGLSDYTLLFNFFPFVLIFGLGPSLYWYFYALTHVNKKMPDFVKWHFAPVILQFLLRISLFTYHVLWMNNIEFFGISPSDVDNWHANASEPLSVIAFWVYLLLSLQLFLKFTNQNLPFGSAIPDAEKETVAQSLKYFLAAAFTLGVVWALTVFAPNLVTFGNNQYYFIEIFLVMLIYWVAFAGYRRTRVIYVTPQKPAPVILNSFSVADMERIAGALHQAMQTNKLYLDPELTVNKLAAHLQVNTKLLSLVLNQHLQKGFSGFVNEYRIADVKDKLLCAEKRYLTITGIAFESGFNSQATFGRAFKSATGMSPKEFLSIQTRKLA